MKLYGLIGYPLYHSWSQVYFRNKFLAEDIRETEYRLFPIRQIEELPNLIKNHPDLMGLNVTIPYKLSIIRYLDKSDQIAEEIGAVNTVRISRKNNELLLAGYNTDIIGIEFSLQPFLKARHTKVLILGTGGASKAVQYFCTKHQIPFTLVSRTGKDNTITYNDLSAGILSDHLLIIQATPLGMYPDTDQFPDIPFGALTDKHLVFDLVYNPEETKFLSKCKANGAVTIGGKPMFTKQAEESWKIWNSETSRIA